MGKGSPLRVTAEKSLTQIKQKIPKDRRNYLNRSIKRITDLLWVHTDEVPMALERMEKLEQKCKHNARVWPAEWTKLSQLPREFLAFNLQTWQPKLTTAILEQIDAKKGEQIRHLIESSTGCDFVNWRLPRSLLSKAVMELLLDRRYQAYGRRLTDHFLTGISSDGVIDWPGYGIHVLQNNDGSEMRGKLSKIGQKNGKCFPGGISVGPDEAVAQNWSDKAASLKSIKICFADYKEVYGECPLVMAANCQTFAAEADKLAGVPDTVVSSGSSLSRSQSAASVASTASPAGSPRTTLGTSSIGGVRRAAKKPKAAPVVKSVIDLNN